MRSTALGAFLINSIALTSVAIMAQSGAQRPQAVYEGQNVSAVSLIANPHRNLEPLYALVEQKKDAPYSQQKIDASTQALQKAGNFPQVHVTVVPEVKGLRINFLLEPAYYLGVVEFGSATREFAYTRLLQVASLADEDPFDPSRLPASETALTNFLRREGYFQASIHSSTRIDDAHQLVNVSFAIEMGRQARIGTVKIEGPSDSESASLKHAVESLRAHFSGGLLKPGKTYSAERISHARSLIKSALTKQRRLANRIRENPPEYDAQTNRVNVSFRVEIGPLVTVRTVGAKLSAIPYLRGRLMKQLIPIFSEGVIDQELVNEGERNLKDYFQKKGYSDVKVTTNYQQQPDQILVEYNIERGKKHKVDGITFQGNHSIAAKELLGQVTVKKSHIWTHGDMSQKLLKQSAANIEGLYRDRGYEEVKVTARAVDHESKIEAVFDIEEGAQTVVDNVLVSGNKDISEAQLTAPKGFELKSGTPFSPRKMTDDRNRISATYLNRGYPNVEVKATAAKENDPHRVNVSYVITENQQVAVSEVVYLGQQHTRLSLITKTAKMKSEAPMQREELLEAESRLYELNIFDWTSVGPRKPIIDQTDEMAVVKVHEAKRNELTYGFGFEISHRGGNVPTGTVALPGGGGTIGLNGFKIAPSQATFASPRGLIEFTRHNMRGRGETIGSSLLLSRLDQKLMGTYGQPHFLGGQWQSLTSISLERNSENPLFTATLGDAGFQVERLISHKNNTRLQLRYDFNKTDLSHLIVSQLVLPQDLSVRLSTVSATLIRDTRDKPLDAHRGIFYTVNLGITPTAFGSSANFAKLFAQYAYYKPLHSVVFANSIRLGLASPFAGSFVPTSQLFFSGGGTSLRGFPIDEAGPQRLVPFCNGVLQNQTGCVDITVPVGGKQLFIFNSEARFPTHIMKALGGVIFYDGGNVNSAINLRSFADNYTNTIGIGLRYATPIGPIRLDLGRNLNPVPGINPTQYYITVGQAF
jgi:outer membrane protein assembly factor BamA